MREGGRGGAGESRSPLSMAARGWISPCRTRTTSDPACNRWVGVRVSLQHSERQPTGRGGALPSLWNAERGSRMSPLVLCAYGVRGMVRGGTLPSLTTQRTASGRPPSRSLR